MEKLKSVIEFAWGELFFLGHKQLLDYPAGICTTCSNEVEPASFHDCLGIYDEVRWLAGETSSPRSMIKRLNKKYEHNIREGIQAFLRDKPADWLPLATSEYHALRKKVTTKERIDWDEEELLWQN